MANAVKQAQIAGKAQAKDVLAHREKILRRRAQRLRAREKEGLVETAPPIALGLAAAAPAKSSGVLVAEGDSWFDYPFTDVLGLLDDEYGYDVESVAHKGDRVEEMAYGEGQLDGFVRRVEKVHARGKRPRAVLVSGGGNDVAGDAFGMLVNDARSAIAGLNDRVLEGVVDYRVFHAYVTIVARITAVCQAKFGAAIPILVHGYDYPVPDGRGFMGGMWFLPGPWLEPGFREKGFMGRPERTAMAAELIDRFNAMLKRVAAIPEFGHVKYVDLRKTLSNGSDHRTWWANELHPTERGFKAVTAKFAAVLDALP
jgi:hypothetical protein